MCAAPYGPLSNPFLLQQNLWPVPPLPSIVSHPLCIVPSQEALRFLRSAALPEILAQCKNPKHMKIKFTLGPMHC